ncbi:MAG: GNAT family N-acetyltransferase [Ignavibacteriaceae bacterium]|jgi:ribosomal protein S18 acetylase RimI-like enzyme|nr:GNAT family N-acetyltransferase [Ignavibacteriaceae bacterium]
MNNLITIEKATENDIDFVIEAIIEADRCNTEQISYCNIFNLSLGEFKDILRNILVEDIEGHEFCLSCFLVAKVNGINAGACCSWIEAIDNTPSYLIKYSLFSQYLTEEKIEYSKKIAPIIKGLHIDREKFVLQIESVYVNKNFRGLGISSKIINEHFRRKMLQHPNLERSQLIVTNDNDSAVNVYKKLGYKVLKKFKVDNDIVLTILPSNCLILMEKNLK